MLKLQLQGEPEKLSESLTKTAIERLANVVKPKLSEAAFRNIVAVLAGRFPNWDPGAKAQRRLFEEWKEYPDEAVLRVAMQQVQTAVPWSGVPDLMVMGRQLKALKAVDYDYKVFGW